MARRAEVRADDRYAAPQPVECARCGATADVVKFSPQHTSVQWTAAAVGRCAEFRARAAEGTRSALVDGCAALRDSIGAAVASGRLAVSPPVYEQALTREQAPMPEQAPIPEQAEPSARLLPGDRGGGDPRDR
jgi:recombinational DNA repair protein (RecF pathway)